MGFYGNYYKISTGDGLQFEEKGQETKISFSPAIEEVLGVTENGATLANRLKTIEMEIGLLDPNSSYQENAASHIDAIDSVLELQIEYEYIPDENGGYYQKEDGKYYLIDEGYIEGQPKYRLSIKSATSNKISTLEEVTKGLRSAAYTESDAYATAEQGEKADSAIQKVKVNNVDLTVSLDKSVNITITESAENGHITVNNQNVKVHGLESAAYKDETHFVSQADFNELKAEIMGTSTNADYEGSRIDKLEAEILGTSNDENYENSRIDLLEEFTERSDGFATADQGTKADNALQATDIESGNSNGTISVKGKDITITGLDSAAYKKDTDFASQKDFNDLKAEIMGTSNSVGYENSRIDLLEAEILGDKNDYGQSRIDALENDIGTDETQKSVKYRITTVEQGVNKCESNIESIDTRVTTLESKGNGEYKGEITTQAQFNSLSSQSLNENDYWYINSSETITISFGVEVITGDIIIYVGKDTNNTKIFIKSQQTLNLINGTGKNSIQNLVSSNKANGNNSAVFGASNTTSGNASASLVVGVYNNVIAARSIVGGIASDTDSNTLFAMGNGKLGDNDEIQKSNAVLITTKGDEYISGDLYIKFIKDEEQKLTYWRLGYPDETINEGPQTICSTYDNKINTTNTKINSINDKIGTGNILGGNVETLIGGINQLSESIKNINTLIKSESETLPTGSTTIYGNINDIYELIKNNDENLPDNKKTIYGNINDIYDLIKKNDDSSLPNPSKSVYGNINEINNKVENINIPQWEIHNNIELTAGWSAIEDYYAYIQCLFLNSKQILISILCYLILIMLQTKLSVKI